MFSSHPLACKEIVRRRHEMERFSWKVASQIHFQIGGTSKKVKKVIPFGISFSCKEGPSTGLRVQMVPTCAEQKRFWHSAVDVWAGGILNAEVYYIQGWQEAKRRGLAQSEKTQTRISSQSVCESSKEPGRLARRLPFCYIFCKIFHMRWQLSVSVFVFVLHHLTFLFRNTPLTRRTVFIQTVSRVTQDLLMHPT